MARESDAEGADEKAAKRAPAGFGEGAKAFAWRAFVVLAGAALVVSLMVILRSYVSRFDCYEVDARTLMPTALPSWAGAAVRRDLAVLPGIPARFSIMQPGICETIAKAFEANPWVDEVISVRKIYPNRVAVEMRLRRPVAGVRFAGRYYLVDANARRLTRGIQGWPQGTDALPVLLSSDATLPPLGEAWPGDAVKAGAAVAKTLLDHRDKLPTRFAAIDVTNIGPRRDIRKSDIILVTHEGTFVKWGRSPLLLNSPGELTPEEKIVKMMMFEKKAGPLSSFRYVDIRFDNIQHGPHVRELTDADFIR
jgi:hypothetical protein